jgi:hypothetical protein
VRRAAAKVDDKTDPEREEEEIDLDRRNRQRRGRTVLQPHLRLEHTCRTPSRLSAARKPETDQGAEVVVVDGAADLVAIRIQARKYRVRKSQLLERPDKSASICPRKTIW